MAAQRASEQLRLLPLIPAHPFNAHPQKSPIPDPPHGTRRPVPFSGDQVMIPAVFILQDDP